MNWAAFTFKNVFQVGENDKYWCTADIGWITGHTYLTYGPLLNGATTVMFEGVPTRLMLADFGEKLKSITSPIFIPHQRQSAPCKLAI